MDRDDIIKMAKKAGFNSFGAELVVGELERFAALVAAKEREKTIKECAAIAVTAEPFCSEDLILKLLEKPCK